MIVADIYRPEQWHDFFIMVGGGTAALTGLVFVAMSLNLKIIVQDATHRFRAIGTLTGFTAVFVICALALMAGQNHQAVGSEWLIVASLAATVYVNGYVQALRNRGSYVGLSLLRLATGTSCYIAEIVGTILLILGHISGLYIASVAMVIYIPFMISGAWLLLVGVHDNKRSS